MGRILMIEFDDRDTAVFDEIMRALEKHPGFEQFRCGMNPRCRSLNLIYFCNAGRLTADIRKFH